MKNLILISITALLFTSCKKCYQCSVVLTTSSSPSVEMFTKYESTTTDFCGNDKQRAQFIKEGNTTTVTKRGIYLVTDRKVTSCSAK